MRSENVPLIDVNGSYLTPNPKFLFGMYFDPPIVVVVNEHNCSISESGIGPDHRAFSID